jgi:hypothetical protein
MLDLQAYISTRHPMRRATVTHRGKEERPGPGESRHATYVRPNVDPTRQTLDATRVPEFMLPSPVSSTRVPGAVTVVTVSRIWA